MRERDVEREREGGGGGERNEEGGRKKGIYTAYYKTLYVMHGF